MVRIVGIFCCAGVLLVTEFGSLHAGELPADVQEIVAAHHQAVAAIQRDAEAQIKAKHEAVQAELEKRLAAYTQAGKLDEAVAIRDYLRGQRHVRELKGEPDPGTLSAFRSQVGDVMYFEVTGSTSGSIWGTGKYTHDSNLATAAVHAGVLKSGEKGLVKVTILPPGSDFAAAGQNGVSSSSWSASSYECYKVEAVKPGDTLSGRHSVVHSEVRPAPTNLENYRDQVGQAFLFEVSGRSDLTIAGSDVYSDDSPLAVAAVHAGCVIDGKTAIVKVTLLGPQDKFGRSARNGVTSQACGAKEGSYKVERWKESNHR